MSKSFIILSCVLAISQLGNVSHALDDVPASTRNYELSNSHEEPMVNSDEDESNRKTGTVGFLILLKHSKENETSMEEESEDDNKQLNGGQKTKRCMALNLLRKTRLISMPKDARKNLSRFAEKSINDGVQTLNDGKSYFRLASRKDTDNILKSLLKSRSSKGEENDPIASKSRDQDPIILVSQDLKKSGNQKPKKYVCYCIDDDCVTKNPKQHSRPNERNILAKNIYSTNEKNRRVSDLTSSEQQNLGAAHNLHCPPGAVLVEESDYSEYSDRKHHGHKRRPVKKCLPIILPYESEAESIGQPMRINFPFAGNRKLNGRVYNADRTLPFVQKLQTLIKNYDDSVEVPCDEKVSPLNDVLGVEDYYSNNQKNVDRYAQVPMAQNVVHPSPYVLHTQHSQYPHYSDGLVGDSQISLKPVDQTYRGHQEPSYEELVPRRPFLDTEECFKKFGPSICTVLETPIPSGNTPKTIENHEEEHEESTIASQWEELMHTTTELPARKINKWNYPTNAHDNDKIAKTYLHQKEAGKAANKEDNKKVSHSGLYSQSRIPTKPEEYHDIPGQYFSGQPVNIKNQPSYNLPRITNTNDKIISSTDNQPSYFDDHGDFLEPNSLIRHSDPNNMDYLRPTANPGESETEDYYDVTEEAREDEVRNPPSVGSVSKFPQLATTSISSPQYRKYTTEPTGKYVNPSLSEDTSEEIAQYTSTPHGSSSRYGTSADQYSENPFHQEDDRNVDEATKYYTTRPSERVGIAKQHSTHGSLSYDEKRLESSTKSPNTVFMKMEEPWSNYETTISTENLKGNGLQGSQRITTVYPVIDNENHALSASSRTQSSNNRIGENAVPSANLYYSIQPEQTGGNVAPTFATKMTSPQSSVGIVESTPINNYSKSGFVSSSTSRGDNQYPTSHVAMKNVVYDTTPLLGINKPGQRKFSVTSHPAQNNVEVKTISSWPYEIEETNIEDNQGEKPSTTHYPARSEIADIDKYSSTQKSSRVQYIGSPQLTNYERTTDKFDTPFYGANEPTTENVISTKKHTDYLRKPVGRPGNQYTTSYVRNLPLENIESASEHTLDNVQKHLSKKVTNHYSPLSSKNWDYGSQPGKKMTSFIDQEASTTDRSAHRQSVGSHRSLADGIVTTSRSDQLNKPTSHLGTIHSPTAAEGFQKSTQQPSKMSSEYNLYSSQSERPLFIMNHRKSTEPEDLELGLPTADNNYSAEDVPETYTTAESIPSWPNEIEETNIEDNQGEKPSTTHYPVPSEIADINKYSSTQKSSRVQYIGSPQLTNYVRTTDKFDTPFYEANEPTTENVISTKKHTDYLRKPVGRPGNQYTTSYVQNLPLENIESASEHTLDNVQKHLSKKVTNNYSPLSSKNWDYGSQPGKKMTSFIDQEASTTDRSAHRQSVGSHRSLADGIVTTSRSDQLSKPASHLGTIHSPTAAEGFQKSTQQPSKMSSEYNLYSSQSERPLFIMNHRKSTEPEDLELGLPTADNNHSAEDVPETYTTAESIFGESTTAQTETHNIEKNRNGKSRHPSKESHQLITSPSKYDDNKEVKRPLETTLSFENNSDMKEEFNGYVASNSFDDEVEEVTSPDSYYEEKDPKNYNDFYSTSSDDSTVADNNETKDVNSSTGADEEVGVANLPKTTNALSINNSKHYMRYHNGVVEESTPKETTLNDEVIIETQSYKEDDNDFSPMVQTINRDMPHLYPAKNYEEKHSPTNYYETVSPQSKDDITRISEDEFENPSDTPYSSTPMSVTHYVRNPSTFSDILKSENVVHDKSPTEGRSNDYSTNQYSQNTPETRIQNPVKDNDKSNAVFEQKTLASQRHIVSNTLPTMNTLKNNPSAVSKKKEKLLTISNKLFGKTNEKQPMIPYDTPDDTPSKENLSTKIENDVSATQPNDRTESLAMAEPSFNTGVEKNALHDVNRLDNHEITQPSYSVTEFSKFKEFTPSSDSIRDALVPTMTTDDEAEGTTILTTGTINQQNDISKKDSSLKQITGSYDRIDNVQKGILKLSATRIATTPETNDENASQPIGTKNELPDTEYMDTSDSSSLEHSQATEYSPYPYEPTSSSSTVGNTPSGRPFAVSEDLTSSALKQVPSSTSKNEESVEKPLGSDSTTSTDKTELLGLFSRAKSAGSSAFDEDQSYLTCAVQKVVQNLISPESNNPYKNAPNTLDTVLSSNQGSSSELPVLKNLFSLPEVKDMVIDTVKDLISEASAEDILSSRLKDQEIESVMNEVVNNLLPEKSTILTTSMTTDKQQYKNGHWIAVPASSAPIEGNVIRKPDDEMLNSIQNIIERPEIGLQGARLPAVQNIIVRAVENLLKKAKKVVNHSLIRETLNNIIARAEDAENSSLQSLSTLGPMPKIPDIKTPGGSLKNMPIIPVIERVFKNGQWSDKQTVLGIRNKPSDDKLSPSTAAMSNDASELRTSSSNHETSMINANNIKVTTDAEDYAFLGESEEKEDQWSAPDVGEVNGNDGVEKILESVDATATEQNIEHEADPENAPIKYYSPNDRILTYIKNHQTPEGKTDTTLHSPDTNKETKHCPSPDVEINEFPTTGSEVEVEHATASDSDEVPVALEETAEGEENGERVTSGDRSTTQTHRHKFAKIPKYHDSSQEATTSTRGLLGAAKSRGKIQNLQENMKGSSNFATPDSDPTYFGKLTLNGGNPSGDKISDLTNTDLFYIGDGVKIPLTIRRMPDGSYALSISEKICDRFMNRKCPCCVPNEGDIVEESRKSNVDDGVENEVTSKRNSYDSGSFEPTESSEYESESKRRYVRSTSGSDIITTKISPVKSFVKKYNVTLNLVKDQIPRQSLTTNEKEIQETGNTRRNKRLGSFRDTKIMNLFENNNQLRRDDIEEQMQVTDDNSEEISKESNFIRRSEFSYDKDINSFVNDLLHIRDVPENRRTEIVVNALDGLINSASVKNLIPTGHQSMTEFIAEDSTEDQSQWEDGSVYDLQDVENKIAGYGYQKGNPILERIRFIKENQHGHGRYKYQRNIDHHARGKMNILKTVLHWLREVFLEAKGNNKN